jgi:hypothetical protein
VTTVLVVDGKRAERKEPVMSPIYLQQPSYARLIAARDIAAQALHRAEVAVHDARGTGVTAWIDAAYARLHQTVLRYEAAASEVSAHQRRAAAA